MTAEERRRALSLLEAYEPLLTSRQRAIMDAYFRFDLSLTEIAEEEGVSRAGVLDAIHVSLEKLEDYEKKLKFIELHRTYLSLIEDYEHGDQDSILKLKEMIKDGI